MKLIQTSVIGLFCVLCTAASAQWQWLDNHGKKVFSDVAPPASVPDKDVLKRPGVSSAFQPAQPPKPATAAASASAPLSIAQPKSTGKDAELEKKKAQAEAAEVAKKKADDQKQTAAKADNCERAKRGLASLESGIRIAQVNNQGEREYLSDEARAAETQRVQGIVASECQ